MHLSGSNVESVSHVHLLISILYTEIIYGAYSNACLEFIGCKMQLVPYTYIEPEYAPAERTHANHSP